MSTVKTAFFLLLFTAGLVPAWVAPAWGLVINEIRIDQPGADRDEFFELAGTPGASLDGLSYLVIGDGAGGSGVVEAVVNLSGRQLSATGLFVAAEAGFSLGAADLVTGLNFENGDNVTHLLVRGFSGALGEDLDADNDGVLDVQPWDEILDALALLDDPLGGTASMQRPAWDPWAARSPRMSTGPMTAAGRGLRAPPGVRTAPAWRVPRAAMCRAADGTA